LPQEEATLLSGNSASPPVERAIEIAWDGDLKNVFDSFVSSSDVGITISDHVLMSLMLMDFFERGGRDAFTAYLAGINPQFKSSLVSRTTSIVAGYDAAYEARCDEIQKDRLWIEAVEHGVQSHMDDISRRQVSAMEDLRKTVYQSTSARAQFLLALASSAGVAVLVAAIKVLADYL